VTVQEVDEWFDKQKDYLNNLEVNLMTMQNRSNANSKKKQEMNSTLVELSRAAAQLNTCEVGHDEILAEGWSKLSEVTGLMATVQNDLAQSEMDGFENSVKDYVLLVRAAKELLENRWNSLQKLQFLEADKKSKIEKQSKNAASSKTAALTAEVQQATTAESEQRASFDKLSKEVRIELEKFNMKKGREMRKALSSFVTKNMNAQLRIVGLWKEILADLEEKKIQQQQQPAQQQPQPQQPQPQLLTDPSQ